MTTRTDDAASPASELPLTSLIPAASATAPGSQTDPADVAELLVTCVKRMRRHVDARLAEHGLSMSRTKVIGLLGFRGPTHQGEIATMFDLAPRTVTELVDGLERDGLVMRTADPDDRRARYVDLTPAGQEVLARATAARDQIVSDIFGSLDQGQLESLAVTLRQLNARVAELVGPDAVSSHGRPSKH
jgi:DNA-binding MarR family transcriptional regulator